MDIGRAIKETMDAKDVKPAQLCKDLHLDAGYVSMLTHSKVKDMKLNRAYAIAKYLGVTTDYLVELAESYPDPEPKERVTYTVVNLESNKNE